VLSCLATQLAFSFAAAPFVLLTLSASLRAWAAVYFYAVVGVAAAAVFFATPAKPALRKALEERAARAAAGGGSRRPAEALRRTASTDSMAGAAGREPVLGLSPDLELEIDDMVSEIRDEVEKRRAAAGQGGVKAS